MRRLLLAAIHAYWRLVPAERRRTCLFAVSCSHHVYEVAAATGLMAGLRALRLRVRRCRPGCALLALRDEQRGALVRLATGEVVPLDIMSAAAKEWLGRAAVHTGTR